MEVKQDDADTKVKQDDELVKPKQDDERRDVKTVLLHYHPYPYTLPLSERLELFAKLRQLTAGDEAQKSAEWYLKRSKAIGGSEIKKALKIDTKEYYSMLCEKAGFESFFGNIFTMFGNIAEPINRRVTELLFNTTIYEFTSLPGCILGTSYSPDGISVIEIYDQHFIVLWEYKSPFSRAPIRVVPDEYRAQITSGLCHIKFADFAIFTNTGFRVCELSNFDLEVTWNETLQPKHRTYKLIAPNVLGLALAVITHEEIGDYKHKLEAIIDHHDHQNDFQSKLLMKNEEDFGKFDQPQMTELFRNIESKDYKIHYLEPYIFEDAIKTRDIPLLKLNRVREFDEEAELENAYQMFLAEMSCLREKIGADQTVLGVIPFKLLDIDLIKVDRDPNYLEPFKPGINLFNEIMPQVMKLPPEERKQALRKRLGIPEPEKQEELIF